ncbi:MAG: hypothetical protein [Olavius algarvensis Gamma 1 endosymbiont]|nr:MAG: hypothetical protein [Olavius algarvensis Gamma 1 endosymbiont]
MTKDLQAIACVEGAVTTREKGLDHENILSIGWKVIEVAILQVNVCAYPIRREQRPM